MKTIFIATSKSRSDEEHFSILERICAKLGAEAYIPQLALAEYFESKNDSLEDQAEFMSLLKGKIAAADCVIIDGSGDDVGLGIEAGAAWALGKPVIVVNPGEEDTAFAVQHIAREVVRYDDYNNLEDQLKDAFGHIFEG